jgi:hypothetical protein
MDAIWMPEAIDLREYSQGLPLQQRTIDVLELGRRYDRYHNAVQSHCLEAGHDHRFERKKGEIIFPTQAELVAGLASAKISVCFPSAMTHPERSGDVETVTHRYFESIASRCLVVGHCPDELSKLFGYNPVVEADLSLPWPQLDNILTQIASYSELVDQNLHRLREVGTWDVRVADMLTALNGRRYAPQKSKPTSPSPD